MRHWHKEAQGASFGAVPGDKWSQLSSHHLVTRKCRQCERRGIPKEQGPKRLGGGHPDVLAEQDSGVLQCGKVPLQPLLSSSQRSPVLPWLPDAHVWLVWPTKDALGNQELITLLGCYSMPALL